MSLSNFTDAVGFSISGLQNISLDSINGNPILSTINISGQVGFLSYDSTTTTLTLLIPTQNGIIALGLLSSTDWNTFNNKENALTFISPLRRVGNTIDFDFSIANTFSGVNTFSNLVNFTNNIQCTGLPAGIKPNILYIDGITGLVSFGAVPPDLLPLNNIWAGATNFFKNQIVVENFAQLTYSFQAFINKTIHPTREFFYVEVNGDVGFFGELNPLFPLPAGGPVWKITSSGDASFVSAYIQNTLIVENLQGAGNVMEIYRDGNSFPTEYLFFNSGGTLGYSVASWSISSVGDILCRNVNTTAGITVGNSLIVDNDSNATVPFRVYKRRITDPNTFFFLMHQHNPLVIRLQELLCGSLTVIQILLGLI
jgi:hypothetical protein